MCFLSEAPSPQKLDVQVSDIGNIQNLLNFKMCRLVVLEIVQSL